MYEGRAINLTDRQYKNFISKIEKDKNTGCWLWTGATLPGGYVQVCWAIDGDSGKNHLIHRISYLFHVGSIPEGLVLDHLCRVRHCVNPKHLEPVTTRENILRGVSPIKVNAFKTHCVRGHELVGGNLYFQDTQKTKRGCKICRNLSRRNKYENDKLKFESKQLKTTKLKHTHCKNNHELNITNVRYRPDGRMLCLDCQVQSSKRSYKRKKDQSSSGPELGS